MKSSWLAIVLAVAGCGNTAQPIVAGDASVPNVPNNVPTVTADAAAPADGPTRSGDPPPDAASAADGAAVEERDAGAPVPPTGACSSPAQCMAIAAEYEQALGRAASCAIGQDAGAACGLKAATTLRCGSCEAWVTDDKGLAAVRGRFAAAGCDGCPFRRAPDGSCGPGLCVPLTSPMCLGNAGIDPGQRPTTGTCGNAGGERVCPDGLKNGAPCAGNDYCIGGGHLVCSCANHTWTCL